MKPLEVEILVAEVGYTHENDRLFHIRYDGSVTDEDDFVVLGGDNEAISARLDSDMLKNSSLADCLKVTVSALAGPDRELPASELEVAVLDRLDEGRCFRRLENSEINELIS